MKFFKKLFIFLIIIILVVTSFLFLIGYAYYLKTLKEQPLISRVESYTSKENYITFNNLSKNYINAVVAVEDHRYYDHGPIDFIAIGRALYTNLRDNEFNEGGSTITQQVAKNVIFNQDKTIIRKAGEVFAAYDLEKIILKVSFWLYMLILHILAMDIMVFMKQVWDIIISLQKI